MIDRTHKLPVVRQCQLLELSRATAYYQATPVSATELALRRRIDELHLASPFAGARMLRDLLRREGHTIGRKRVRTLMTRMGITAVYRQPRTSQRHPAHRIYPYLLRHMAITRPNQVWAADITYIPMRRGLSVCHSGLGESPSVGVAALQYTDHGLLPRHGAGGDPAVWPPGDLQHGSRLCQFTSLEFTGLLKDQGIQISMDGKGCWRDNVCVERLWKASNTRRCICTPTTPSGLHTRAWSAI
jgi:putative transposase